MPRLGHQTTVRALRVLLAAALVGFTALVALYLFGRQGRPEAVLPVASEEPAAEDGDFRVRSKGFEFALTRGDQVVFEIRGREQRSDRTGRIHLEEVGISMLRDGGEYRVEAQRARYDQDRQRAELEGDVVIRGEGLTIASDEVDLEAGGKRIFARERVRLTTERGIEGWADSLEADLDEEVVTLRGDVVVRSAAGARPPFRLETRELFVRERGPSAHARGGVLVESGGHRLEAQRLNLFLDPETREVSLLRVLWEVEGEIASGAASAPGAPLEVEATVLSLYFDPQRGEPERIEIRGLVRRPATVRQRRSDGGSLEMTLTHLAGHFEEGVLTRADLSGPVEMIESPAGGAPGPGRRASAERGEARFEGGDSRLAGLTLIGEVAFTDGALSAVGERAYLDMEKDAVEIFGEPAHLVHEQGRLDAPRALFRREDGLLHAMGGVVARLSGGEDGVGRALPGGESDRPVRVESEEAFWESSTETAIFRGAVRAWQDDNTLFADQLRSDLATGRTAASGGVRSIWKPPTRATADPEEEAERLEDAEESEKSEEAAQAEEELPPLTGPMEITADEMTYEEAQAREATVVYEGSVHAEQDWTSMRCETLSVRLDESGAAREMECAGEVRIVDSRNGRVLEGDRALYEPGASEVEVFGDPLTVLDADGTKVEGGRHFTYDLESGNLRLTARVPGAEDT